MRTHAIWSNQALSLVLVLTTLSGCAAEPNPSSEHVQEEPEAIFGLSIAERTRASIKQAALASATHQGLAEAAPLSLIESDITEPIEVGTDAHVLMTPYVSAGGNQVFLVMDVVERGEASVDDTDPSAWHVLQSLAAYVELDAQTLQHVKQQMQTQVQTLRQSSTGFAKTFYSSEVVSLLRETRDAWQQGLTVTALDAWTLSAADAEAGKVPQRVTLPSVLDGATLLETLGTLLSDSAFVNGPQGWLALLTAGKLQVPPLDEAIAWVVVVLLIGVFVAVVMAGAALIGGAVAAGAVTLSAVIVGALVFLGALAAIVGVGYCFYEQGIGRRACTPRLRMAFDAMRP